MLASLSIKPFSGPRRVVLFNLVAEDTDPDLSLTPEESAVAPTAVFFVEEFLAAIDFNVSKPTSQKEARTSTLQQSFARSRLPEAKGKEFSTVLWKQKGRIAQK